MFPLLIFKTTFNRLLLVYVSWVNRSDIVIKPKVVIKLEEGKSRMSISSDLVLSIGGTWILVLTSSLRHKPRTYRFKPQLTLLIWVIIYGIYLTCPSTNHILLQYSYFLQKIFSAFELQGLPKNVLNTIVYQTVIQRIQVSTTTYNKCLMITK